LSLDLLRNEVFWFFFQFYFNEDYIFLKTSFSTCCDLQMNVRMQMLIYFQLCIRWVSLLFRSCFLSVCRYKWDNETDHIKELTQHLRFSYSVIMLSSMPIVPQQLSYNLYYCKTIGGIY